jgi:hypothetical protein
MRVQVPGPNLNEVPAWDGEANMLPPGEYCFEVAACAVTNTKNNNPQLEMDLTVIAGADTEACNGAAKKHWVVMTEKAAGRVRNMLDACGVQMEADGSFDSDHFIGTQFIAEVYEDSYDKPDLATGGNVTKLTNKIRKERPVTAGFSSGDQPTVEPAQQQQQQQTAPATRAPAPAARPAPAAAPSRPLPPGPRVVGNTLPRPGARAPIPGKR